MSDKKKRAVKAGVCTLVVAALVGIDALIKKIVVKYLLPVRSVTVIPKVLALTYTENTGAAFSLFQNNKWILVGLTAALIIMIIVCMIKNIFKTKIELASMLLVVAGGLGNIIDRVVQGYVVDYIEVLFVKFAVFNFADILVVVGCFTFAIYSIYSLAREKSIRN